MRCKERRIKAKELRQALLLVYDEETRRRRALTHKPLFQKLIDVDHEPVDTLFTWHHKASTSEIRHLLQPKNEKPE